MTQVLRAVYSISLNRFLNAHHIRAVEHFTNESKETVWIYTITPRFESVVQEFNEIINMPYEEGDYNEYVGEILRLSSGDKDVPKDS